jgi:hypothetical protein
MDMDQLFEIAAFSRWDLKAEWEFVKAMPKKKEPAGAPAPPAEAKS